MMKAVTWFLVSARTRADRKSCSGLSATGLRRRGWAMIMVESRSRLSEFFLQAFQRGDGVRASKQELIDASGRQCGFLVSRTPGHQHE